MSGHGAYNGWCRVEGIPLKAKDCPECVAVDGRRCTNGMRHWYAYYGYVGSSSPTCLHCGAPNPRYDPGRDPFADTTKESA
jgi:hypothetical protein